MAPRSCHTTTARPSLVLLPSLHLPHLLPWGKWLEHNKLLTYNLLGFFVSEKSMAVRASSLSELCYSTYLISYQNRTLHTILQSGVKLQEPSFEVFFQTALFYSYGLLHIPN
jgi:hypothetical protein